MKKAIATLTVLGFLGAVAALESWASNYKLEGRISSSTAEIATITDARGLSWDIATDKKILSGTRIIIHFHDNMTPNNIYDDVVRSIDIIKEDL